MGRFSVRGYNNGVQEGPSNNDRPLQKKPRTSNFIVDTSRRFNSSAAAFDSDGRAAARNPNSTSGARQPSEHDPDATEDESEDLSEDESTEDEQEDVQSTEARVNSIATDNGVARGGTPKSFHVTLTDPDALDCAICLEPLSSPVYQCENGHIACASCCTKMRNKCPNCSMPIGYNRCRAIEKVLESMKISCTNKLFGCNESLSYCKKLDHEKTCTYTPCHCPYPYPYCDYVGSLKAMYLHFAQRHSTVTIKFRYGSMINISLDNTRKHFFLQESKEKTLFVLNRSIELFGNCVSVICIAPSSLKKGFSYIVNTGDKESWINYRAVIENTQEWIAGVPAKKRLIVPDDFVSSNGQLKLDVIILCDGGL